MTVAGAWSGWDQAAPAILAYQGAQANPEHAFTPYTVPSAAQIPSIYFDPSLEAQRQSINQGAAYAGEDETTMLTRLASHLGIDQNAINLQADRSAEDYGTADQNARQNQQLSLQQLARNYQNLAGQQLQTGNQAGVLDGGYLAQAAARRAANQANDQTPINLAYQQAHQAAQQGEQRASEDRQIGLANALAGYQENTQDAQTTGGRAQQGALDAGHALDNQEIYQATQNGFTIPLAPTNEFGTGADAHRVVLTGTERIVYAPDGHVISRSPRT